MRRDTQRLADYLSHILEAIDRINRYTDGLTQAAFAAAHPTLPLSFACQMRNAVAHGYFSVDLDIVWKTISSNLPALQAHVKVLITAQSEVGSAPKDHD